MPERPKGATWATREHVFVDRVASPWLIRHFVDPAARFEFHPWNANVTALESAGMICFDFEKGGYTHRERDGRDECTFEVLVDAFALGADPALRRVADVVHAADVSRDLDAVPEARGLKAISWGWRFEFTDDHEAVREGAKLYDALYTWARMKEIELAEGETLKAMGSLERYRYLRAKLARA